MNFSIARSSISSPIQHYLEELHREYAQVNDGTVATYIPELARADKSWFGICIATTDGHVYEVGDSRQLFTIQSISKPLVYGLVLEDHGEETVLNSVGVEPTGDAFNSISLDPQSGCPLNPMINAGAIAIAGLVKGTNAADKLHRILQTFSRYAGHEVAIDPMVYRSEKDTGHRNRAIGHMLRNFNVVADDPEPVLDLYFQQCSIAVDCRDLAVMAASLANGGINPITGLQAIKRDYVENVLSVMATCGMYDYAGEWIYKVGMPAKSGVGGGILAVLPGQLGIGVFSPALDTHGNSVRGLLVCRALSSDFNLHLFDVPGFSKSVIRSSMTQRKSVREESVTRKNQQPSESMVAV
jgi:glutaminase